MYNDKLLCLNSNLNNYKLLVLDGNYYSTWIINKKTANIPLSAHCDCLRIILAPLDTRYNSTLYYNLLVKEQRILTLSFNFSKKASFDTGFYRFNLIDKTYGLKINGSLLFTSL